MQKVVAITGASSGIGRATALRLARDGAALALCARRLDRLNEVAEEVRRLGGDALAVAADVTRANDMQRFVSDTLQRFGRLDVMLCNAGFGVYGTIDTVAPERMREVLDVNFMGTYLAARAALPHFRANDHGHLIIVSSIVGRRGVPYMGAYAATKFAQTGLGECLRAEVSGSGIHVSMVYPVSTETEFFDVMKRASGFTTRAVGPRQSADHVANPIARTIDRPAAEVFPYAKARGLILLTAIAPAFCDRFVKKWGRTPVER
jgi:short-subunit dehydrogenase